MSYIIQEGIVDQEIRRCKQNIDASQEIIERSTNNMQALGNNPAHALQCKHLRQQIKQWQSNIEWNTHKLKNLQTVDLSAAMDWSWAVVGK